MKVGDITAALEVFAPLRIQEEWDNSGLIIGSAEDEVHGVLVGFDCTPELIDEAVEKGCNMVVTHHPLIFKGIRRINAQDPVGAAVMRAVQHGVAVSISSPFATLLHEYVAYSPASNTCTLPGHISTSSPRLTFNSSGSPTSYVAVSLHSWLSATTTVYAPALRFSAKDVVSPALHAYLYSPTPPVVCVSMRPSL